jgi:hypothetical protein
MQQATSQMRIIAALVNADLERDASIQHNKHIYYLQKQAE